MSDLENPNTVLGVDIDKTHIPYDTGQEAFEIAEICPPEQYFTLMDEYAQRLEQEYPEKAGSGNQLVYWAHKNPEQIQKIEQTAIPVLQEEIESREGIETLLEQRKKQQEINIASSAGYHPFIEAVTNGNFHYKITGNIEDGQPLFNGQPQKRENIEQLPVVQQNPYYFIGDSNGDIEAIRGAHESGGAGIAIGPELETAQDRVNEASVYIADEPEHYFTGAALAYMTLGETAVQQYQEEIPENPENYEWEIGELGDEEIEEQLKELEELLQ